MIVEKFLEFEILDVKVIKLLFEYGVMFEGIELNDYLSEKEVKIFEEVKCVLEEKDVEK